MSVHETWAHPNTAEQMDGPQGAGLTARAEAAALAAGA